MQEIKGNPQLYTTKEGTKNWIPTNLYQETALCLDSFFWLKVEASTTPFTSSRMPLSSSAILDWHHCNFPWYFDWRHFPPKVYGRGRFDLPHQQQDYVLRPRESICWISPCLISPAQRPLEDITCMLFGYLALNEQPLLARLRPAGGTEHIVFIAESTKQFVLCKSFRPDFTLTFR